MRSRWAALGLVALLLLAGCAGSSGDGGNGQTSSTSSTGRPVPTFDGQAAWAFTYGAVTKPDGSPHFRVPGTPDHVEAARWLHEVMANVTGWTVEWQNFTGVDYAALDKGAVENPYYTQAAWCDGTERNRLATLSFSNLVATLPGSGDRTLVLGAHWESKRFASQDPVPANRSQPVLGANDGASGVGILLQLMWTVHAMELPYTLQVVFFDGEDGFEDCHPLAGSLWFVHLLEAADREGMRMLLLDMVGDPDARFIRETTSERCDPALVDLLHDLAPRHGLADNFPGVSGPIQDDHVPFAEAGIPAVDLIDFGRGFQPYWHTTHDTMDNIDATMLGRVGALVLDAMADPEFTASWPGPC